MVNRTKSLPYGKWQTFRRGNTGGFKNRSEAIAYLELIENIQRMLGKSYSQRIEAAYLDYVNEKYRK